MTRFRLKVTTFVRLKCRSDFRPIEVFTFSRLNSIRLWKQDRINDLQTLFLDKRIRRGSLIIFSSRFQVQKVSGWLFPQSLLSGHWHCRLRNSWRPYKHLRAEHGSTDTVVFRTSHRGGGVPDHSIQRCRSEPHPFLVFPIKRNLMMETT